MIGGFLFRSLRLIELLTIIPIIGMLSFFVNGYVNNNQLTPNYILVLFIVSVLAGAWALVTLFRMDSVRRNAPFVIFIDLCFFGAFIAGVFYLRGIANADCVNVYGGLSSSGGLSVSSGGDSTTATLSPYTINYQPFGVDVNKTCSMLKASFALGIMNVIFFFNSAIVAFFLHRRERAVVVEKTSYRRSSSHGSRRGHHRRSSRDSRRHYHV